MNDQPAEVRAFVVADAETGTRLDRFLTTRCPEFSRNQIQNALSAGRVTVEGRARAKGYRLTAGERVSFSPLPPTTTRAEPQELPLQVVYQDDDIVVVNKQAGLVVHPAPGHPDGTLVNALLHHCGRLGQQGESLRPGIVHRLDRDTTGLLVVALTEPVQRSLAAQLKERQIKRIYLALNWGRWPQVEGDLEDLIARSPTHRQRMAVVATGGRWASTHYRILEDFEFVQLCRVTLGTGRTHQIRVQFAHRGHPLVGDPVYGDDKRARNVRPLDRTLAAGMVKAAGRQMLHALQLTLKHPRSGREMVFEAPLPADLEGILQRLRGAN